MAKIRLHDLKKNRRASRSRAWCVFYRGRDGRHIIATRCLNIEETIKARDHLTIEARMNREDTIYYIGKTRDIEALIRSEGL